MKLQKDLKEFIELLNSHKVEYLVIGGHAVAFHGYPRFTADIDFLLGANEANIDRIILALQQFGAPVEADLKNTLRQPEQVIQLGRPPNRIDLLTSASGVHFESARACALSGKLDGVPVLFPDFSTLIKNKRASGRTKDLADVEELEKIMKSK